MRFLLEFDGGMFDGGAAWYQAHVEVAAAVGWSKLDKKTFRRVLRKEGWAGDFLHGAAPPKLADYHKQFAERLESPEIIGLCRPWQGMAAMLAALSRYGSIRVITQGSNVAAREHALKRANLLDMADPVAMLNADPRRRGGELRILAENDERSIVAACSDSIIRAADAAELFTVGLSCGPCNAARLHQAGARIVYEDLKSLTDSLASGAADLVRAGMLPLSLS